MQNADGDLPLVTPAIKVPLESRSSSLPTPMDPLQAGASGALPHVGALLNDPKVNPKALRLSAANRAQLQNAIDEANRSHAVLRADLHKEMRVHARAVIEAGGGEPIVPGVRARAPKGMTMVSVTDKALGYYHRVFFQLGSVPELAAIDQESKNVVVSALLSAAEFISVHGQP
jgi:hypothetical protein